MICGYCGIQLNPVTINSKCLKNDEQSQMAQRFIEEEPPIELQGTKQHYFGKPIEAGESFMARVMVDRTASVALNSICCGARETGIALIKKLRKFDEENTGRIPLNDFIKTCAKFYDVESEYFHRLGIALDSEANNTKTLSYRGFADYVEHAMLKQPKRIPCKAQKTKDSRRSSKQWANETPKEVKGEKASKSELQIATTHINIPPAPPISATSKPPNELADSASERVVITKHELPPDFRPSNGAPGRRYFNEADTRLDLARSILNTLQNKEITEGLVLAHLEEHDTKKEGVLPVNVLYKVLHKLSSEISTENVEQLLKKWFPEAVTSGKVKYAAFLSKLF